MVKNLPKVLWLLILVSSSLAYAQDISNLKFIIETNSDNPPMQNRSPLFAQETDEIHMLTMGLIRMYQVFVSSQDKSVCNFTPSCSQFGLACVNKYGIIIGGLMTSDRLQRCNFLAASYYSSHPITGKFDDPIETNFLFGKK
jgi:putative membrane protein insertion efficiency factor